ncbi:hypothetical protein GW17_00056332 [Ensete ventricosum]|nr:hypothetical protein GW17_00056332 [Ensete ventricosum]RZR98531.1 hypothetical protein BHM03_00027896 [Ensete ventricosum]
MSSSLWSHSGEEGGSDQVSESRVKRRRQWQRDGDDDSGRGGRWGRQQRGAGCWQQRQAVGRRGRRGDGDAVAWLCRGIGGLGSGREKKMEEATMRRWQWLVAAIVRRRRVMAGAAAKKAALIPIDRTL